MQAVLVMFRSDGERRSFSVTRDVTVIGRRDDCDLRIPLNDISRKHARLIREDDHLRLEDLGSSNGTHLNGQRIERDAVVQAGDSIQVGPVVFVLQVDGYPADEELNPITAESAAAAAMLAPSAVPMPPGMAPPPAPEGYEGYEQLEPLPGEEPTMDLGHAGEHDLDGLEPIGEEGEPLGEPAAAAEEAPLDELAPLDEMEPMPLGEDEPVALADEPMALTDEPAAPTDEDQLQPIDDGLIPLDDDDDGSLPLADGHPAAKPPPPQDPPGGDDAGLDDLLIDIAPEPPGKRH